jgi:hypothetical protein
MVRTLLSLVQRRIDSPCQSTRLIIRQQIKPDTRQLVLSTIVDLTPPKSAQVLENAFFCQQLIVLQRKNKRPSLKERDQVMMAHLASRLPRWQEVLLVVQPRYVNALASRFD